MKVGIFHAKMKDFCVMNYRACAVLGCHPQSFLGSIFLIILCAGTLTPAFWVSIASTTVNDIPHMCTCCDCSCWTCAELAALQPCTGQKGKHVVAGYGNTSLLCVQREFVLVKRNAFLYIFRFFLTMFMAVVTATLFLRTQLHPDSVGQGQLYFGVIFFSLIMLMFDGFAEMTFTILRLPGFFKQRGAGMKRPSLLIRALLLSLGTPAGA